MTTGGSGQVPVAGRLNCLPVHTEFRLGRPGRHSPRRHDANPAEPARHGAPPLDAGRPGHPPRRRDARPRCDGLQPGHGLEPVHQRRPDRPAEGRDVGRDLPGGLRPPAPQAVPGPRPRERPRPQGGRRPHLRGLDGALPGLAGDVGQPQRPGPVRVVGQGLDLGGQLRPLRRADPPAGR